MPTVRGLFDVKLHPQPADEYTDGAQLARMTIDKQYHGVLEAVGKGQMLTGMGEVKGSAGYVAIERVTGTLDGRRGSFILQHSGTMDRGAQSLLLHVIPDTGTDRLRGLSGAMQIVIDGRQHEYVFEYQLADE